MYSVLLPSFSVTEAVWRGIFARSSAVRIKGDVLALGRSPQREHSRGIERSRSRDQQPFAVDLFHILRIGR